MRIAQATSTDVASNRSRVWRSPAATRDRRNDYQLAIGNQALLRRLSRAKSQVQCKLTIGAANDPLEAEADRVADQVMRMPDPDLTSSNAPQMLRCKCADCEDEDDKLHKKSDGGTAAGGEAPPIVHEVLSTPGQPLDAGTSGFFEPHFGKDLSHVRVHSDAKAADSATAVNALAYTVGSDVVFGAGQYAPHSAPGRHLLAHEMAHVVQQGPADLRRQPAANVPDPCAPPSNCPSDFCLPFPSKDAATADRNDRAGDILDHIASIAGPAGGRVRRVFHDYIFGGSGMQDLTAEFADDFTKSVDTLSTTQFLNKALEDSVRANPPAFPPGASMVTIDIPTQIPDAVNAIDDPNGDHKMEFTNYTEAPGLLAGGIGKNEAACPVGAQPSGDNDARIATGTADVSSNDDGTYGIVPHITFEVIDTVDFCPGNCGGALAQYLTVPMSRWEASGISGDVPFRVTFAAPSLIGAYDDESA